MTAAAKYSGHDLLSNHDWTFPVPIAYGPGRLGEIGEHCAAAGIRNPLLMTDRGSAALPFVTRTRQVLQAAGLGSGLYAEISPNPQDVEISAARAAFRDGNHDAIIGMGGGSGMDGAKATCLTAYNDHDLWAFDYDGEGVSVQGKTPFPPLICVPTTAGTGAETESTAMITDTQRGLKLCIWHPQLKPSLALLDPELTVGLPANLTAWTGIDALVHAIEAYCVPDYHPLCDGIALQAMALIRRWLPTAVSEPTNLAARGGMQVGACLGGIAFLKGLGLVHAISHMVGADHDTHHGLTNAIALPAVLRFNAPALDPYLPAMAQALSLHDARFDTFYHAICQLLDDLQVPKTLGELGIPVSAAPGLAAKAHRDAAAGTNPRQASIADIETLLEDIIGRGR